MAILRLGLCPGKGSDFSVASLMKTFLICAIATKR